MKKLIVIFCFAVSCTSNRNNMDNNKSLETTEPIIYGDRLKNIGIGGFLTTKKSMDYKLSDIFDEAKKTYEAENIDNKKFILSSNKKIEEFPNIGAVFGGNDTIGMKIQKQVLNDKEYLICQNTNKYDIRILFHTYNDYDLGFVSSTDSINNSNLIPGFILIDKLNLNIYFILASMPNNSSVFKDNKSITKVFILDNNLFPVSSLTYQDGALLYKSICIYISGSNDIEFETVILPDIIENKAKSIKNSSLSDMYNYLAYDGIPLGDIKVNIPFFMKEKPLWLMGSLIEYKFNKIR